MAYTPGTLHVQWPLIDGTMPPNADPSARDTARRRGSTVKVRLSAAADDPAAVLKDPGNPIPVFSGTATATLVNGEASISLPPSTGMDPDPSPYDVILHIEGQVERVFYGVPIVSGQVTELRDYVASTSPVDAPNLQAQMAGLMATVDNDASSTFRSQQDPRVAAAIGVLAFDPFDVGDDIWGPAGQSNSNAYGLGADKTWLDLAVPDRIRQYVSPSNTSNPYPGQIVVANDPLAGREQAPATMIGHAMRFGRGMLAKIKANRRILFAPVAMGSTGFQNVFNGATWDRTKSSGVAPINLALELVANMQAAYAKSLAEGGHPRYAGVLWLQGEADYGLTQSAYAAYLDDLIDFVRAQLGVPDLTFIVGQMVPIGISARSNFQQINLAHIDTPRRKTNTAFAYGPTGDDTYRTDDSTPPIHYNAVGQRAMGDAMVRAYDFARANVLGVDPVPPAAVALAQSGTSAIVTVTPQAGRVTDRLVEYRVNGGAWAPLAHSADIGVTFTIPGVSVGQTVQARVSTVNEAGTSVATVSSVLTMANLLLADVVGLTPQWAHSLRRTVTGYAGAAIRVRRSSDSAEMDVGFSGNDLDTATMLAWGGSSSLYVKTIYDHSGAGRHQIQTDPTLQARIVNAGALETSGGKACLNPAGSTSGNCVYRCASVGLYAAGKASVLHVVTRPGTASAQYLLSEAHTVATNSLITARYVMSRWLSSSGLKQRFELDDDTNALEVLLDSSALTADGAIHQLSAVDTGTAVTLYADGGYVAGPQTYTRNGNAHALNETLLFARSVTTTAQDTYYTGRWSESVAWPTNLNTAQRQAGEANQKTYFGTP